MQHDSAASFSPLPSPFSNNPHSFNLNQKFRATNIRKSIYSRKIRILTGDNLTGLRHILPSFDVNTKADIGCIFRHWNARFPKIFGRNKIFYILQCCKCLFFNPHSFQTLFTSDGSSTGDINKPMIFLPYSLGTFKLWRSFLIELLILLT